MTVSTEARGAERDVDGSGPAGAEADLDRLRGAEPAGPGYVVEVGFTESRSVWTGADLD
ncbi:hypothetical protein [Streptomyces sp. NPDC056987]|uniref:hypothetical protein n=1 Tax=Streptomyces sp. NPDC056987 TaxID=3345988 RepID=UPI00363492DB